MIETIEKIQAEKGWTDTTLLLVLKQMLEELFTSDAEEIELYLRER